MKALICDRASHKITHREYTDEGFLRVPGTVARVGIQQYLARELGLPGDPNRIVNVYRPPEEVFHADSLTSFDGVDVTINHPDALVNSSNYKNVTAGVVRGSGRVDGDFIVCDLIVKDRQAIDAINSGKCELSAGYTAVYDAQEGVTPQGERYEFIQREIRINHVALVDKARAGANARVFDHSNDEVRPMTHKVMLDSGRTVEIADEAAALLVGDTIDRLKKSVADAEAKAEKAQAAADAAKEQLEEARQLTSDSAIQARVKSIATVQAKAQRIAGESFTCDSVDTVEIARAAMKIARPKVDWSDKSAAYVQAAFDAKIEEIEEEKEEEDETNDAGGVGKMRKTGDMATIVAQLAQLAKDGAGTATTDSAPVVSRAQANFLKRTGKGA